MLSWGQIIFHENNCYLQLFEDMSFTHGRHNSGMTFDDMEKQWLIWRMKS